MNTTLPKDVVESINECLKHMATDIIGQTRPLLVSYASIIHRCPRAKEMVVVEGTRSYDHLTASIIEAYGNSWVVTKIPDWGYCFNPKEMP